MLIMPHDSAGRASGRPLRRQRVTLPDVRLRSSAR